MGTFRIAIVGGGPSGFYAAEALLRSGKPIAVDMFERLPTPYGLVRFGVAPDHPKLKLVTAVFERIARTPGFRLIGGVRVGEDVAVAELRRHYHAVILASGAEEARALNIPGERLMGSHSASDFVGWYNGHPEFRDIHFDLDSEVAVVVGHGNVALDVARILLKTPEELARTDIAAHAWEALRASRVREVHIVGRGGPKRAKFAEKELAEFQDLAEADIQVASEDLAPGDLDADAVDNSEARNLLLLIRRLNQRAFSKYRRGVLRFHLSPIAIEGAGRVARIVFERTPAGVATIACGLVFSSIGLRAKPIVGAPYDEARGVHANIGGRVAVDGRRAPGLYVCGWSKRGPSGTIGANRGCSGETVQAVLDDLAQAELADSDALIARLAARAGGVVDFADWKKIDAAEMARGAPLGKPREKFVSVPQMLAVVAESRSPALAREVLG